MRGQIIERTNAKGERTSFTVRVFDGRDDAGKRRYINQTVHGTKRDAQRILTTLLGAQDTGALVEPSQKTVSAYLAEWTETTAKARLRERTYREYQQIITRYVTTHAIGRRKLSRLTPADIQARYNEMLDAGLSPRSVRYLHAILHSAFKQAVRWHLLPHNPTDAVDLPKQHRREMRALSPKEAARFLKAAQKDRHAAFWPLLLTSGLRPSEACGLTWADVDGDKLRVRRALVPGYRGAWRVEEPKTPRSVRVVPLPASVVETLKRHRAAQAKAKLKAGPAYTDNGFVFADALGAPLDPRSLAKYNLPRILAAAKLPPMRMYDLRHTCATLLLAAGEHAKIVSERLGHSTTTLTMDTYTHVLPGMQQGATDKLEAMLFTRSRSRGA